MGPEVGQAGDLRQTLAVGMPLEKPNSLPAPGFHAAPRTLPTTRPRALPGKEPAVGYWLPPAAMATRIRYHSPDRDARDVTT